MPRDGRGGGRRDTGEGATMEAAGRPREGGEERRWAGEEGGGGGDGRGGAKEAHRFKYCRLYSASFAGPRDWTGPSGTTQPSHPRAT